jgi:RHS repeat-associated protein
MNRVKAMAATSKPAAAYSCLYGAVGNRKSLASTLTGISGQAANYDNNDRVVGMSYDANGNTLGAGGTAIAYDSQDRLTSFNNGAAAMVYDGDGNRVSKTAAGATTVYPVDEGNPTGLAQVVEELSSGGTVQRRYLYGLERIGQTQVAASAASYYGYDGHGDVRYLTDVTGKVTDTYDYDAFGNVVGSTGATANVYRYQGEAFDSETGLYYLRARYYDPVAGRFLSVDPMADQGEHPYSYAGADPVNGHDPTRTQDVIEYTLLLNLSVPPRPTVNLDLDDFLDCIKRGERTCTLRPAPSPGPKSPEKKCCDDLLADWISSYLENYAGMTGRGSPLWGGLATWGVPGTSAGHYLMGLGQQTGVDRKRQSNPSFLPPALVMHWNRGRTSAGGGSPAAPESSGSRAVGGRVRSQRVEPRRVLPGTGAESGHAGPLSQAACASQPGVREPLGGGGSLRWPAAAGQSGAQRSGGVLAGWPSHRNRARV